MTTLTRPAPPPMPPEPAAVRLQHARLWALRDRHRSHNQQHPSIPSSFERWLLFEERVQRCALGATSLLPRPDVPVWKRADVLDRFVEHIRGVPSEDHPAQCLRTVAPW